MELDSNGPLDPTGPRSPYHGPPPLDSIAHINTASNTMSPYGVLSQVSNGAQLPNFRQPVPYQQPFQHSSTTVNPRLDYIQDSTERGSNRSPIFHRSDGVIQPHFLGNPQTFNPPFYAQNMLYAYPTSHSAGQVMPDNASSIPSSSYALAQHGHPPPTRRHDGAQLPVSPANQPIHHSPYHSEALLTPSTLDLSPQTPLGRDLPLESGSVRAASETAVHSSSTAVSHPDMMSRKRGIAFQSWRPNVSSAMGVTISWDARPPAAIYEDLSLAEEDSFKEGLQNFITQSDHKPADLTTIQSNKNDRGLEMQVDVMPNTTSHAMQDTPQVAYRDPLFESDSVSGQSKAQPLGVVSSAMDKSNSQPGETDVSLHVPPSPAPTKKSWASLLRSSETGTGGRIPNTLPISSVQGFSVPASTQPAAKDKGVGSMEKALGAFFSSSKYLTWKSSKDSDIVPRGLINLGNMCFANTVLQVLQYCSPFRALFTHLNSELSGALPANGAPLLEATIKFLLDFDPTSAAPSIAKSEVEPYPSGEPFVPTYVYEALKEQKRFDSMRGGQQEDAEEFLGFYLDTLEEELLSLTSKRAVSHNAESEASAQLAAETGDEWLEVGRKSKATMTRTHKSVDSPISRIFGGKFRTVLKVPGARETAMVDPWSRLQLDIQPEYVNTIEEAIQNIATTSTVQIASSTRAGMQVDATQQVFIDALPPILVLHLKRFLYDTNVGDVVKLRKKITFGVELEFPRDAITLAQRGRGSKFRLLGVLNHHGLTATGGHYTLDVRHEGQQRWIRLDDDFVQDITDDDLQAKDFGDDRTAYLLFYKRISPPVGGA